MSDVSVYEPVANPEQEKLVHWFCFRTFVVFNFTNLGLLGMSCFFPRRLVRPSKTERLFWGARSNESGAVRSLVFGSSTGTTGGFAGRRDGFLYTWFCFPGDFLSFWPY